MVRYRKLAFGALVLVSQLFSSPLFGQKGGGASPAQQQGAGQQGAQTGGTPYFEAIMEAYGAVNELSEAVAGQVCKNFATMSDNATVIIFDPASFQNVAAWQAFSSTATALKSAYETLLTDGEVNALFPNQGGQNNQLASIPITSASDLAGLITALASSTTNTASTFAIQDSTMAVSLAHQFERLNTCKVTLKYYPLFGSYVDLTTTDTLVQQQLKDLNKIRQYLQHTRTYTSAQNSVAYALLSDLNTQYDALIKSISSGSGQGTPQGNQGSPSSAPSSPAAGPQSGPPTASQGSGSGLLSLEQGAALNTLLADRNTYVLYADVVAAGGTQRDRKNLITLLTGDWITYSGGVIVNVALIHSQDTALVLADTLRYRTELARHISAPKESKLVENTNAGENEPSICNQEKRLRWWEWRKAIKPCPR